MSCTYTDQSSQIRLFLFVLFLFCLFFEWKINLFFYYSHLKLAYCMHAWMYKRMVGPTSLGMRLLEEWPDNGVHDGHATGNKSRPAHSFETAPSLVDKQGLEIGLCTCVRGGKCGGSVPVRYTIAHSLITRYINIYGLTSRTVSFCQEWQEHWIRMMWYSLVPRLVHGRAWEWG